MPGILYKWFLPSITSLQSRCYQPQLIDEEIEVHHGYYVGFLGGSDESACNVGDLNLILGLGRSPGGGNTTHSSILAWEMPWTEEPGSLQSMGSQRVEHNWVAEHVTCSFFHLESVFPNEVCHLTPRMHHLGPTSLSSLCSLSFPSWEAPLMRSWPYFLSPHSSFDFLSLLTTQTPRHGSHDDSSKFSEHPVSMALDGINCFFFFMPQDFIQTHQMLLLHWITITGWRNEWMST